MTGRGRRPRRWLWLVGSSTLLLALLASACGSSGGGGGTTVTYVGVAGRAISFGTTESPTGCNPNTSAGDTPGTQTVLAGVLPSPFVPDVVNSASEPMPNSELIVSAEPISLKPLTIVYTLNPKAVWSDGVPITAADFKYAWEEQRGDPATSSPDVASIAGYRDIASVTGSNGGHTVTVQFKTTFADWQELFANLVPAHVMEKLGWSPACSTVDPAVDLSGGPFMLGKVTPQADHPGPEPAGGGGRRPTPSRSPSTSPPPTAQLAQWMASGYVQVAAPSTVTQSFLTQMTGLPGAQSEVDTSATLLQLDMASSVELRSPARPPVRHRPDHRPPGPGQPAGQLGGAGDRAGQQPSRRAGPAELPAGPRRAHRRRRSRLPPSSTSTTTIGAGGSVNFPLTSVPTQAAAFIAASGLDRTPGDPYYHSSFGVPFQLHMVYDSSDPWATAAAPAIQSELQAAGLDTTLLPVAGATQTGKTLAAGFADLAVLPQTFTPYMSQTVGMYTQLLGPHGEERLPGLDGLLGQQVRSAGDDGLGAAQPDHGHGPLHAGGHDAVGQHGLAPAVRRADRPGLEPHHCRRERRASQHQPAVVRAVLGGQGARVDERHHAVAAGAVVVVSGRRLAAF